MNGKDRKQVPEQGQGRGVRNVEGGCAVVFLELQQRGLEAEGSLAHDQWHL